MQKSVKGCNKEHETPKSVDLCLMKSALEKENLEICNEIVNDLTTRDDCYDSLAFLFEDANICQRIESRDRKVYCYYELFKGKEETYCQSIENKLYKKVCETEMANAKLFK